MFEEGTDLYFARQQVAERLQSLRQPAAGGHRAADGAGCHRSRRDLHVHRRARRCRRRLRRMSDAEDCATRRTGSFGPVAARSGCRRRQHDRRLCRSSTWCSRMPERLLAYGVSRWRISSTALERNNANRGAGYIERNGQQVLMRVPGQLGAGERRARRTCARIVVKTYDGAPVRVGDVADVTTGSELRTGAATQNGARSRARHGADARRREQPRSSRAPWRRGSRRSTRRCRGHHRSSTTYDRTKLVDKTLAHRAEEPRRGRAAGDRGAVPAARQPARRAAHRAGHSAGDADDDHRDGAGAASRPT